METQSFLKMSFASPNGTPVQGIHAKIPLCPSSPARAPMPQPMHGQALSPPSRSILDAGHKADPQRTHRRRRWFPESLPSGCPPMASGFPRRPGQPQPRRWENARQPAASGLWPAQYARCSGITAHPLPRHVRCPARRLRQSRIH